MLAILMSLVHIVGLYMRLFSFDPQASDVGKAHSLVPGTVSIVLTEERLHISKQTYSCNYSLPEYERLFNKNPYYL
jgi:hypothetical protein